MKNIKLVGISRSGLIVAFDDNENQVSKLQQFTIADIIEEKFNSLGYTIVGSKFMITQSDDSKAIQNDDRQHIYLTKD